jgi:hypothetical protein
VRLYGLGTNAGLKRLAVGRHDDQKVSVHSLHLLQSCLVYVNTLMLQCVLAEPTWAARMTAADARGLTPLSGRTSALTARSTSTWSSGSTSICGRQPEPTRL